MINYIFFTINLKKEEALLESWRQKGWRLIRVNPYLGRYQFERAGEGGFVPKVRIDVRTFNKKDTFQDYLALFEACGWQHLFSTRSGGTQHFIQCRPDADDDIFSDIESRAGRYKRLSGSAFWRAFLFETPFALGRGFAGVLFLLFVLLYAWFGLKALYWSRKEMKKPDASGRPCLPFESRSVEMSVSFRFCLLFSSVRCKL